MPSGKKWSDATIAQATSLQPTDQFLIIQASTGESKRIYASTITPYLKYVALLTQTGTDTPVATILENTLGGTVVWSYQAVGEYRATLAGAFLSGKVVIFHKDLAGGYRIFAQRLTDNIVQVLTYDPTTPFAGSNGRLSATSLEIRVYP